MNDEFSTPRLLGNAAIRYSARILGTATPVCFPVVFLFRRICRFCNDDVNDALRPPSGFLRSPFFPIHVWSSERFNCVLTPSRRFRRSHRSPLPPKKTAPFPPPLAFIPQKDLLLDPTRCRCRDVFPVFRGGGASRIKLPPSALSALKSRQWFSCPLIPSNSALLQVGIFSGLLVPLR